MTRVFVLFALSILLGCQSKPDENPQLGATGKDNSIDELMQRDVQSQTPPPIDDDTAAVVVPPPPPGTLQPADPASIAIKEVDFAALEQNFAAHKGKLLVVDFWATWCTVCREKFPKFAAISREYAGKDNIVFATVANDEVTRIDDAREFLLDADVRADHFLLDEDPNDFAAKFQSGLPLYLIYGTDGEILFRSTNVDELVAKIRELPLNSN